MKTLPNDSTAAPKRGKRWGRTAAAATGALLVGAGIFGATTASAADNSTSPSVSQAAAASTAAPSTSPSTAAPAPSAPATAAPKHAIRNHAKHPFLRLLRAELRTTLQGKPGYGDKAHEIAYLLIHHGAAFAKLPANLQTDLKTLEAAPAASRDADATHIKDTALNGGYGDKIQKAAKNIQARLAKTPATPAPQS